MGERPARRSTAGGHGEYRGGRVGRRHNDRSKRSETSEHGERGGRGGQEDRHGRGRRPRRPGSAGGSKRSPQRRSDPARRVALEVLTRVRRDDAFANLLLPELLGAADLPASPPL